MITHELFRHSPNKRTDKENDSPLSYATTYTKTMTLKVMTRQINYSLHEYDLQGL